MADKSKREIEVREKKRRGVLRQLEDRNSGGPIMRADEIRRHYEEKRRR